MRSLWRVLFVLVALPLMAAQVDIKTVPGPAPEIQKVAVVVTDAPDLVAAQFTVTYDPQKLTYKGIVFGDMAKDAMKAVNDKKAGEIRVALASGQAMVGDGNLAYLLFSGKGEVTLKSIFVNNQKIPQKKLLVGKKEVR